MKAYIFLVTTTNLESGSHFSYDFNRARHRYFSPSLARAL